MSFRRHSYWTGSFTGAPAPHPRETTGNKLTSRIKRAFAVLGVAGLAVAGVSLTAASAQALPGSVTFSDQTCGIPTGGLGGATLNGVDFTVTNSADAPGALSYKVVLNNNDDSPFIGSITLEPGQSQETVIPFDEDSTTVVQVKGINGSTIFAGKQITVNCVPNFSATAKGTVSDASCAIPTGGITGDAKGVKFTFDNSIGTSTADYAFIAGDTEVESGTIAGGDAPRVRTWDLVEDQPTLVEVTGLDAAGKTVVLDSKTVTLNCVADTPTITSPTSGEVVKTSAFNITGTGTAGDVIAIGVADSTADMTAVPTATGAGVTVYSATVAADGTFSVAAALPNGSYTVLAVAARAASGTVPASVSGVSNVVAFSVAAPVVPGAGTGAVAPGVYLPVVSG